VSALIYSVEILRRTHILTKLPPDPGTLNETRFAQLKKKLPSTGVIGYVADDRDIDKSVAWRRYAMTQYALAPLIVERTTDHELVLGVFKDVNAMPARVAGTDLLVIEEFGEGVVLFKKK
jgi:hypothetical protein